MCGTIERGTERDVMGKIGDPVLRRGPGGVRASDLGAQRDRGAPGPLGITPIHLRPVALGSRSEKVEGAVEVGAHVSGVQSHTSKVAPRPSGGAVREIYLRKIHMGADRSGRNNSFVISIIWIAI
jgi:hypothetical protein